MEEKIKSLSKTDTNKGLAGKERIEQNKEE